MFGIWKLLSRKATPAMTDFWLHVKWFCKELAWLLFAGKKSKVIFYYNLSMQCSLGFSWYELVKPHDPYYSDFSLMWMKTNHSVIILQPFKHAPKSPRMPSLVYLPWVLDPCAHHSHSSKRSVRPQPRWVWHCPPSFEDSPWLCAPQDQLQKHQSDPWVLSTWPCPLTRQALCFLLAPPNQSTCIFTGPCACPSLGLKHPPLWLDFH